MGKRAAIYCRISDDREGRRLGVDRQEEDGRALLERMDQDDRREGGPGYHLVKVFIDNDISASTLSKKPRPDFEEMMRLAESGGLDLIVSPTSARLTRRPIENERLLALYADTGTLIKYCKANDNDLSTARGRSRARDDARRDAEEAEEISERVERDVLRRARQGVPHGGQRAFGWTVDHEFDPYEHPILLELVDRALAGEAVRSLARDLERRGVPQVRWRAPMVIKWQVTTIRKMLTAPRIAGLRARKGKRDKKATIYGKATWPAAVSEATWRQLVALFDDSTRNTGGSTARVNLGTSLFLCSDCDRTVSMAVVHARGNARRDQYCCKYCGLYRKMDQVDTYVSAVVVRMLEAYHDDPELVDPGVLETVEFLRSKIEATKRAFADDDTMSPAELKDSIRHLRGRLESEEAKLVRSRRHHIVGGLTGEQAGELWGSLSLDRKRAVIDSLIRVRLHRTGPGPKPFDPATVEISAR